MKSKVIPLALIIDPLDDVDSNITIGSNYPRLNQQLDTERSPSSKMGDPYSPIIDLLSPIQDCLLSRRIDIIKYYEWYFR